MKKKTEKKAPPVFRILYICSLHKTLHFTQKNVNHSNSFSQTVDPLWQRDVLDVGQFLEMLLARFVDEEALRTNGLAPLCRKGHVLLLRGDVDKIRGRLVLAYEDDVVLRPFPHHLPKFLRVKLDLLACLPAVSFRVGIRRVAINQHLLRGVGLVVLAGLAELGALEGVVLIQLVVIPSAFRRRIAVYAARRIFSNVSSPFLAVERVGERGSGALQRDDVRPLLQGVVFLPRYARDGTSAANGIQQRHDQRMVIRCDVCILVGDASQNVGVPDKGFKIPHTVEKLIVQNVDDELGIHPLATLVCHFLQREK
jgi:hypothetical protein